MKYYLILVPPTVSYLASLLRVMVCKFLFLIYLDMFVHLPVGKVTLYEIVRELELFFLKKTLILDMLVVGF